MKTIRRQSQSSLRVSQNAKTKREHSAASSPRTDRAGFKSSLSHPRRVFRLPSKGALSSLSRRRAVVRMPSVIHGDARCRRVALRKQLITPERWVYQKHGAQLRKPAPLKSSGYKCPGKDRRQQIIQQVASS